MAASIKISELQSLNDLTDVDLFLVSDMESIASYSVNYATLKNSITIDVQEQIAGLTSDVAENKTDITTQVQNLTNYINQKIEEITGLNPGDLDSLSALAEAITTTTAALEAEVTRSNAAEVELQRKVDRLTEKIQSIDERIELFLGINTLVLGLESQTPDTPATPATGTFIDEEPGGDVSTFVVSLDPEREVYALDGIPQPTVQVPRGDVIDFDLTGLGESARPYFRIYKNGMELTDGVTYSADSVRVNTNVVPAELSKIYYKNSQVQGMGWVIEITDI